MSGPDQGGTPEERLCRIAGNAPADLKEFVHRLICTFMYNGFGTRAAQGLELVEVSLVPSANMPLRREARVVLETTVREDMLNSLGRMHGACIVHLVDICSTLPIAALSLADGGTGSPGVSQNINTIFHAPASLGDELRLINTSMTVGARAWSARTEIWDVTHRRLVASATQVKMEASPPKL